MIQNFKRRISLLLCVCLSLPSLFFGSMKVNAAGTVLPFHAVQDAFVSNFNGQGSSLGTSLNATKLIYGKSRHVYVKFDLSSIDTNRYKIGEMNMMLSFRKSHAPNELVFTESESTLRGTSTDWTVTNVTYNNRPYEIAGSPSVSKIATSNGEENFSVDVSSIIQNALTNGRKVVSIHLATAKVDDSTVSASELYSSRNASSFPAPTLSVTLGDPTLNDGVDRTSLNALIAQAEQLIVTAYTPNSWAVLSTALTNAKALVVNNTTQVELDQVILTLQTAINNLVDADQPVKIAGPNMGNYYNNGKTAAMIMKMKNAAGNYVKVDPVTEKLSLTANAAEASPFALYVYNYFATVNHVEPEVGATRTSYAIKSLNNNKYLTIQNYFTAEEFLSNTHHYFNIVSGEPNGTAIDRTFEIKASASLPGWNERFYVDQYANSGFYRIWSHLSTMRDDVNFDRFNVKMTEGAMQSSGTASENTEYKFYFEQVTDKDQLEISQEVSGNGVDLFWKPVNGDTNPANYSVNGTVSGAVYASGLMHLTLSDLRVGNHTYAVQYNGSGYQASTDVNVRIFSHPGILLTMEDLQRMKARVQAKEEPWYSDYQRMLNSVSYGVSSVDYQTTVFSNVGRGGAPSDSANIGYFEKGGNAAYFNALQWVITGEQQFADKAVDLLRQWANTLKVIDGRDRILGAGINAYKYASAAEIIKYYDGGYTRYSDADFKALKDMMINVVYPVIQDAGVPMLANGNWDVAALVSMIAIGVLNDNTEVFDRAMSLYQDIHTNGSIFAYVNDSGQTMETGRDQGHAMLGLGYMSEISLIAKNQHVDLYSLYDNRLAKAFEYMAKYNLYAKELNGEDVPFVAIPNVFGDTSRGYYGVGFDRDSNGLNRGELRPVFEQGLALYNKVADVDLTWTTKAAAAMRPQGMVHFDNLNFGTLTYYRDEPIEAASEPYFQMRTRWEPLYQRNWSTVNGEKVAETLNSYFNMNENGELTTSVMKKDAPFYQMITNEDGTYSIRLLQTNTYLSVKDDQVGNYNVIKGDASEIGTNEKFILRSSGVGPFYLASPKYENRIVYQDIAGSGSNAVLTLRLGTKKLSQITDVPNITTSERLIFMYNGIAPEAPVDLEPTPASGASTTSPVRVEDTPKVSMNGNKGTLTKNDDGSYLLNITEEQIKEALSGSNELNIDANEIIDFTLTLPVTAMGDATLRVDTDFGTVTIPNAALQHMMKKFSNTLNLRVRKGSYMVELYDNGKPVLYNEPNHPLTIALPFKVAEGHDASEYVVIKKENGKNVILPLVIVDGEKVTFDVTTMGIYDIMYNGKVFHDIPSVHWAAKDIAFVTARKLFEGTGDNMFSSESSMTRAMFTQVLANLESIDASDAASSVFTDVPSGQWYTGAVNWAAKNGIVGGTGQDKFSPDDSVTREQMAVMLYNYAGSKGYRLPSVTKADFVDGDSVSPWARKAVDAIAAAGILNGRFGGYFDPQTNASRAEVAAVFARFIRELSK
ncbi:hypothetical protein ASG89_00400 [Paenibacillus sp. Soil766]|uniref:S-layer homology domain-containing protein n=1 Tax=Paenibacillus sp. Soil766 TaxID=1736404 RepID=UPI00070953C7|nr:S-layer homology domain-containing protein [Paenibacillus sp. Soil766]KRF10045.1 hypothetical protein ASG89_00400 [Paenibacillus sp. Soil766]